MQEQNLWAILEVNLNSTPRSALRRNLAGCLRRLNQRIPKERTMLLITCDDLSEASQFLAAVPSSNILLQTQQERGSAVALLPLLLEIEKKDRHARIFYAPCDELQDPRWLETMLEDLEAQPAHLEASRVLLWATMPSVWNKNFEKTWVLPQFPGNDRGYGVADLVQGDSALSAAVMVRQGALCATGSFAAPISILLLLYMLTDPTLVQSYLQHYDAESFVFWGDADPERPFQNLFADLLGRNLAFLRVQPLAAMVAEEEATASPERGLTSGMLALHLKQETPPRRYFH